MSRQQGKFDLTELEGRVAIITGAGNYGIGWGLAGYCPGPVVASLLLQPADMLPFLVTLLAGAFAGRWLRS